MHKNQNECYDITGIVVEKAVKILLIICRIKRVKCDRISFSFRDFEHQFMRQWYNMMYKEFPYDTNSKMAKSTDVSPAKIRYIVNKK